MMGGQVFTPINYEHVGQDFTRILERVKDAADFLDSERYCLSKFLP